MSSMGHVSLKTQTRIRTIAAAVYSVAATMIKDGTYV